MRPHDILRLRPHAELIAEDPPAWVATALRSARWVVVRRAQIQGRLIPVGIRGADRSERFAARIDRDAIAETITPEALAASTAARRQLAPFAALDDVARAAAQAGLVWGPTGSVGFELATGIAVVTAASDLDLVLRPARGHTRDDLAEFQRRVDLLGVRVDATVESDGDAVALREWLVSPARALIKTPTGPRLGAFSW